MGKKNHKSDARVLLNEDGTRNFAFGCCNIPLDT